MMQVFLEGKGVTPFLFNYFKVYHFEILKLLDPLQNCVIKKKIIFFCCHNFMKKSHSKSGDADKHVLLASPDQPDFCSKIRVRWSASMKT